MKMEGVFFFFLFLEIIPFFKRYSLLLKVFKFREFLTD